MDAKAIVLLGFFLLSAASPALCEEMPKEASAVVAAVENSGVTAEQPDPYKDVTWDSVTKKNQSQDQTVTVYNPRTRDADFVSVSSTGPGSGTATNVGVVVPQGKKSKRWFFW